MARLDLALSSLTHTSLSLDPQEQELDPAHGILLGDGPLLLSSSKVTSDTPLSSAPLLLRSHGTPLAQEAAFPGKASLVKRNSFALGS